MFIRDFYISQTLNLYKKKKICRNALASNIYLTVQ